MSRHLGRRGFLQLAAMGSLACGLPGTNRQARAVSGDERLFELGTVTYNIAKDWDLETLIEKCEKLQLKAVELRTTHKHGVEPDISKERRAEVRKRFENTPVQLFGLGSACEFHSPDAEVVKRNIALTKQFVKLAHDLGATGVKVRPNGLATKEGIPVETTLKQIGLALQECGQEAQSFGVEIWLEVHGRDTAHPPHVRKIMDYCAHPSVGVTWNSNPQDRSEDGSIREYYKLLEPFIRCVHINELWSDYPYRELFTLLRKSGYDRFTMAEIQDNPDPERFMRYYRALWDELSKP